MSRLFLRCASLLLWCEERWRAFTSKPMAKWGMLALFVVGGIFVYSYPTLAQEDTTAPGIIDRFMLLIGALALGIASALGQLIVLLLDVIVIPLMQYNGFSTSPVVSAGWAIVRDVVNMFFVIVLIFIAFGTILGVRRFAWQQQVPRLLIFALVINFSKTLCGLMIDMGQVIMLTFANALKDIAGGNFIQLFGLNDILAISLNTPVLSTLAQGGSGGTGQTIEAFDWMAAGVMALLMMIIVTTTVLMLAAILAYRIVMLWVLIVVAPMAWFMGGAEGVIKSDAYSNWWGMFKCYIIVGPVLTFFMWLTLAVAGSGNIAASAGFTSGDVLESGLSDPNANVAGSLLKAFEVSRMTSFIIGIAMMYAGFDAAAKACSSAGSSGGFVQDRISFARGSGAAAAGAGAYVGAKAARRTGRLARSVGGDVKAAGTGAVKLATGVDLSKAGRANMYREIAKKTNSAALAGTMGSWAENLEKKHAEEVKAAGAPLADKDRETRLGAVIASGRNIQQGRGAPILPDERNKIVSTLGGLVKDKKARKELEASGVLEDLWKEYGHELHEAGKGDHGLHEALEEFEKTRPDVAGKVGDIGDMDDVRKLDKAALANTGVQDRLKEVMSGFADENGREISAYDFIARGRMGADKQKALGMAESVGDMVEDSKKVYVNGRPPVNLQTGDFGDAASATQFTSILKSKPEQYADIPTETLRANGGNNQVARAAAEGLSVEGNRRLFAQYADADEAGKRRLQQAMDNVSAAIDAGIATAADPRRFENMRTSFDRTRTRVENVHGVPTGTTRGDAAAAATAAAAQQEASTRQAAVNDLNTRISSIESAMTANIDKLAKLNSALETAQKNNLDSYDTIFDQVEDLEEVISAQRDRVAELQRQRSSRTG